MSKSGNNSGPVVVGAGFTDLLALVFIVLKLTGYIDWSWWWVLAPIWIPLAVVSVVGILAIFLVLLHEMYKK